MRNSPLRRKTRLRARAPMRRRRYRPRRQLRVFDQPRVAWTREQPCCAPVSPLCRCESQAHHAGRKPGMGLKADDDTCIALCAQHHLDIDALSGPFRGWTGEQVRAWEDGQIAAHRARYALCKTDLATQLL